MCYDDEDDEDGNECMGLIVIGEDGKAEIHTPEDYVDIKKEDMEIIQGFLKENKKLFNEYMKKHNNSV